MRLRSQILLQSALLVALPLATAAGLFHHMESLRLTDEERSAKQTSLNRFLSVGAESIISKDDFLVLNFAKGFQQAPEIALAALFDADGRVLFDTQAMKGDASLLGTVLDAPWARAAAASPGPLCRNDALPQPVEVCSAPILHFGRRIGTAALAFDDAYLARGRNRALNAVEKRFEQVALAALTAGFALALLLAYGVTRPLELLSAGARRIGEGRLDTRLSPNGGEEVRALAAEFNRMAEKLAELDDLKDSFIRNVSHELRNPLFAIQGHLQLMELDKDLSAKNRERLGVIDDSCRRVVAIVSDILDLAKMQARRMSYAMARVSVPDAVAPVLAAFQALAQKGGVALAAKLPAGLPPVRADAARVQQVLTNLLSNALKFTPRGGAVTASARREAAFVVMEVRDTGPGIPADQMSLLFQKFSQLPGATRAKASGTGLGLAISKEIVEAHGGKIWAESAPGRGTAFLFTLPVEAGA